MSSPSRKRRPALPVRRHRPTFLLTVFALVLLFVLLFLLYPRHVRPTHHALGARVSVRLAGSAAAAGDSALEKHANPS